MAELRGYINRVMQVITGKFRGRKLKSVPTTQTRPTLGRVKESIFDMINEYIPNSVVLDLFAGSGALGIECISRGAKQTVFVDSQKESLQTIKTNLKNDLSQAKLIKADYGDAIHMLSKLNIKFNLVLLDPPFDSDYAEKSLYLLHKNNLLEGDAIIMCETSIKKVLQNYPQKYIIIKNKSYGTIGVTLLKYIKD